MANPKKQRDPLFAAAVLKLSFRLAGTEATPAYKFVYDGVLKDLEVDDATVEKYLADNYDRVHKAARGKERGE